MSNIINYIVSYDSDYLNPDGSVNGSATVLTNVTDIQYQRNIAPSEDNATITLAGIQRIQSAREIYIYRVNSDLTYTLKFRGMTTNPEYDVSDEELVTTVQVNSLWYMLQMRLFQIAGKSPPPLQPNTNPYLVYLNPTLGLNFGQLWADILTFSFQESYSTGHLPTLHLANLQDDGEVNQTVPYLTDFDYVVVNDNMNLEYQSISATVDRLVTSALFNAGEDKPFLAEYRMDIGDFPYSIPPRPSGSLFDTTTPKLPTATVMLFDPVHSKLGNGQNRTGICLGDNSLDAQWVTGTCGPTPTPTGLAPDELLFLMSYIEFGVYNGYCPVDTIIFSEGDNFVSIKLTYDYLSMNNSYVLTGGSFQGSDVVSLPIDNQRSIAEFGLKQTNQPLQNVVDAGEIQRFVGTSINFFQHPIPNIVLKPDYVYASTHTMYAGDYILVNAPSLAGVIEDSNGQLLEGSYVTPITPDGSPPVKITLAFTARIKTIDISWNPNNGEDITLTLTFPIQNVPLPEWNAVNNTQWAGSPGGAMQFMYTTVQPAAKTMLGRGRQMEGAATYQSGEDFIASRNNPFTERVTDSGTSPNIIPSVKALDIPMYTQHIQNNTNAIVNDSPTSPTTIDNVKGDDILIYQFGVEVDTPNTAPSNTASAPSSVYLTVLQPDGMAIIDTIVSLNQMTNILSLISKSHKCPVFGTTTAPTSATMLYVDTSLLSLVPDSLIGLSLSYTSGPAKGQSQTIVSNTSTTITTAAFSPVPNTWGDTYQVNSASAPFLTDEDGNANLSGRYEVIVRNSNASSWCPDPLFETISQPPTVTPYAPGTSYYSSYVVVPCIDGGVPPAPPVGVYPVGLTYWGIVGTTLPIGPITYVDISWKTVTGATCYNVYRNDFTLLSGQPDDMLHYYFLGCTDGLTYHDTTTAASLTFDYWAFPPFATLTADSTIGPNLVNGDTYWYVITAVDIAGSENVCSAPGSFDHLGTWDTEPALPASPVQIYVEWPSVSNAVSYNIYRGTSYGRTLIYQIATGITDTNFTDDGSYAPNSITPPLNAVLKPGDNTYTVYINYAFLQDPAHTQIVTTGGSNNPSTAIIYDPTQRRVYATHGYV
jgi:hypothetical protein